MLILELIGVGLFVGIASSLFGIGGGILISPLLPLITQITQREAVGTALFCIFVVVSVNSYSYWRHNLIEKKKSFLIGIMASLGAISAGFYSQYVPDLGLRYITGVILLFIALNLFRKKPFEEVVIEAKHRFIYLLGFLAGSASGLSGVGTGVLLSPVFVQKRVVAPEKIAPTLNAILAITSFFGSMTYLSQGTSMLRLDLAVWIIFAALASAALGRRLNARLTETQRKNWMAVMVLGLALLVLAPLIWRHVQS